MENQNISYLFVVLSVMVQICVSDDLFMQIIAPKRQDYENGFDKAIQDATFTANARGTWTIPNVLRNSGYTLDVGVTYTDNEGPTPDELTRLYCSNVFTSNTSVILYFNYEKLTHISSDYMTNIAHNLRYPVISWNPFHPGIMQSDTNKLVLQIAPTIYHECKAMVLIMERYNWTEFSIITTKQAGQDFLDCMDLMVKETSITQGYLTKPRFIKIAEVIIDLGTDEEVIYFDEQQVADVKRQLKPLIKAKSRIMLLHADKVTTDNIIDVAAEMKLTGDKYGWLLTSLCIGDIVNSQRTVLPPGMLAISQNKSIAKIQESISSGVKVWTEALKTMIKSGEINTVELHPNNDCDTISQPWLDSQVLYRHMKEVVIKETGKPPVSFTDNGVIEHVELNLLNVRPFTYKTRRGGLRQAFRLDQVGRIYPQLVRNQLHMAIETNEIVWPGEKLTPPLGRPEKRYFRVVTIEEEPFMMYVPPDENGVCGHHAVPCVVNGNSLRGNETTNGTVDYCCTGLCIEILEILAEQLHFEYYLYDVPDGQWGVKDARTGEWNGLVREIQDGHADMVLTAFIINQIRMTAIDFSVPFIESGITIMVSLRKGAISPYAFLEPYDFYSWILILIFSVHATGASIFIFEWLSPSGLAQGKTSTVEHKFSLFRSFWLIWAMLFGAAVSIDVPRGVSSRFLANVWALFALVFLASYTANLAAFMITIDEYYDLSGIEDWRLLNPTKLTPHFKFATIQNSSTDVNLKDNYPRMHKYMSKYRQPSVQAAKESLKNQSIHAFIYDANVLEYTAGRDDLCYLLTVGRWYSTSGYGIGVKQGSALMDEINKVILNLQHTGEIERLQAFWLSGACHAKKDKKDKKSSNKIGILNFISAFILLAAGVLLGVLLLALEHLYFKSGRKCLKKYDKCGCCALVSLSMGKSLTFEQSVFEAVDMQRKHKCKDPICEMHLWKARHQLDMALLKMKDMQDDVGTALLQQYDPSITTAAAIENISESEA